MAITEEPDSPKPLLRKSKQKPQPQPQPPQPPPSRPPSASAHTPSRNPFQLWFYFTLFTSLITLVSVLLSSLSSPDAKTWFLNLPPDLRLHYSSGRSIKAQTAPNHPQVEVFFIQQGPTNSDSHVLIVHGIGCSSFTFRGVVKFLGLRNVHAVALDLPCSGFSDKSYVVVEENVGGNGFFGRMWEVYEEIKEKGLFWGFDQLVEQGYVEFEENDIRVSNKDSIKSIEFGSEEMGRVLGQVVESIGLAPVDLVLHDSAFGLSANWIAENRGLVRSVVVFDSVPSGTAWPLWTLEMPLVRQVVLGFRFLFERVVAKCCVKSAGTPEVEAHRILLKGIDGGRAVVGMGKKQNLSFDLSEWSILDGVKGLPIRVLWSRGWSDSWTTVGHRIADVIPQATLVTHSGGRWIQEEKRSGTYF
ncbi:protein AUXIN RESPONSE 4 [Dorcoceras hygrometricum]|uniref:Protein AUXIN RESPONSE 4 n=1 Tax=Dorcoceras hygrometricum TaxID=472368 RepID=A0A2Z7AA22_9LAMI|nr:protein AUXIN RESPONSE 4 [Dorcoceras hygrometricum]